MFKNVIKSSEELKDFRAAVRSALNPELLMKILTEQTITDPSLVARLNQAVGQKAKKPLSTRLADDISAAILQFNNSHEMFAHYSSQKFFVEYVFSYSNKYDDGVVSVFAADGHNVTVSDLVFTNDLRFDPSNPIDKLFFSHRNERILGTELPKNAVILPSEKLHGMYITFSQTMSLNWNVIEDYASAADAFSGIAENAELCVFSNSHNDMLSRSVQTKFFDADVHSNTLASLLAPLIRGLPQYAGSLSAFIPTDVKGEEYRWDDGVIGLMFSSSEMWMVAYDAKNGRPIAMSSIRLHRQDKRRELICA